MLAITFKTDVERFAASIGGVAQRLIPEAARDALNDTAMDSRTAELGKIGGVFDRPVSLTKRAVLYRKASLTTLTARIFLLDELSGNGTPPAKYLTPQIKGGPRPAKGFEKRLRAAGVMRPDEFAIPAIGQPRDAYGNLPRGLINRVLSQLQAAGGSGYMANETSRSKRRNKHSRAVRYFVPSGYRQEKGISRLPRGIYERRGKAIRAVMIFVSGAPTYRRRYDFGQATLAKAGRVFGVHFSQRFRSAIAKHSAATAAR